MTNTFPFTMKRKIHKQRVVLDAKSTHQLSIILTPRYHPQVIFIAAAVAVGASRSPRTYEPIGDYRDSPFLFNSPPPPLPRAVLGSYPRHHGPRPFSSDDDPIFSDEGPPSPPTSSYLREGRIFFESVPSSYFSARRPQAFYQDGPLRFGDGQAMAQDYRGRCWERLLTWIHSLNVICM